MTITADPFTIDPLTATSAGPEPATPAQAAVYQQLRGHLAHLKLTAAAEAVDGPRSGAEET